MRSDIIRRLMKHCALAQYMDRVTALRDEFTKITEEESMRTDERLREIDFGVLDGLTKHGIAHFHPEERSVGRN